MRNASKRRSACCFIALPALFALMLTGCGEFRLTDPDVLYVAFGDSSTAGPSDLDYPDALADELGWKSIEVANEGKGGDTIAAGVDRLRDLLASDVFPNAQILLLWSGGGDLVDWIGENDPFLFASPNDATYTLADELDALLNRERADLEAAISLGRANGLTVYVATYFPILGGFSACNAVPFNLLLPGQAERANDYLDLLNEQIRLAADDAGAVLIDIATELPNIADNRDNYHNCNHLSETGNTLAAQVFADTIRNSAP